MMSRAGKGKNVSTIKHDFAVRFAQRCDGFLGPVKVVQLCRRSSGPIGAARLRSKVGGGEDAVGPVKKKGRRSREHQPFFRSIENANS